MKSLSTQEQEANNAAQVAEALLVRVSSKRSIRRHWLSRLGVQCVAIVAGLAVITPYQEILACACSEVVVGQGAVTSSMSVDDRTAELYLNQSDIELPGVIPIKLIRKYGSNNGGISIFDPGPKN